METIKVLAFDPRQGVAVVEQRPSKVKKYPVQYHILAYDTIDPDTLPSHYRKDSKIYNRTAVILESVSDTVRGIIGTHRPDFIATETAFFYQQVQAYESLQVWITNLCRVAYRHFRLRVYGLAPQEVKRLFTGNRLAKKPEMYDTLMAMEDVVWKCSKDNLTEHSTDAIAVAITFLKTINERIKEKPPE